MLAKNCWLVGNFPKNMNSITLLTTNNDWKQNYYIIVILMLRDITKKKICSSIFIYIHYLWLISACTNYSLFIFENSYYIYISSNIKEDEEERTFVLREHHAINNIITIIFQIKTKYCQTLDILLCIFLFLLLCCSWSFSFFFYYYKNINLVYYLLPKKARAHNEHIFEISIFFLLFID